MHAMCDVTGKIEYTSEQNAMNAAYLVGVAQDDGHLVAYECEYCGNWHIGHSHWRYKIAKEPMTPDRHAAIRGLIKFWDG